MQSTGDHGMAKQEGGLLGYMELLRYGPTATRTPGTVYASVPQIAKVVKLSPTPDWQPPSFLSQELPSPSSEEEEVIKMHVSSPCLTKQTRHTTSFQKKEAEEISCREAS
jgi:hypothetical protein